MTLKISWKSLLAVPCAASLLAAPALAAGKSIIPDKAQLASQSKHMAGLVAEGEETVRIDLADRAQYDFVVNRLLASGNTPENSPRLFERLSAARAGALAGNANNSAECVHIIEVNESPVLGTTAYNGQSEVSCVGGNRDYVFSDIRMYREGRGGLEVLAERSAEDYRGGGFFDQASTSTMFRGEAGQSLKMDSLALAFDDASGSVVGTYAMVRPDSARKPGDVSTMADVANFTSIEQPGELIGGSPVRICLNRGLVSATNIDCDYATVESNYAMWPSASPYPPVLGMAGVNAGTSIANNKWIANSANVFAAPSAWNFSKTYLPLQGVLNAGTLNGANCSIQSIIEAKAELRYQEGDPTCGFAVNQLVGTGQFGSSIVTGNNVGSFRTLVDFGVITCPATGTVLYEKKLNLRTQIRYNRNCSGAVTSTITTKQHAPIIDFRNSCFAEGTQVLMADGSMKPIEQVQMGEKVIVDEQGTELTVTGISRGGEMEQMLKLVDAKGREVKVTSKHPVLTPKGAVQADRLAAGDKVLTHKGAVTLASVTRVPVDGMVYNLNVGTPEELKKLGRTSATLFANGFLMGDNRMQLNLQDELARVVAKAEISKAWKKDYRNDVARKAMVR